VQRKKLKRIDISKKTLAKLKQKAPWLYSGDIKGIEHFKSGEIVQLTYLGSFVAIGFLNPKSKIVFRSLSFKPCEINRDFFKNKIIKALQKRKKNKNFYEINNTLTNSVRLIHSEADGLPGLIADIYDKNLIVSFTTAGIDAFKSDIIEILKELIKPDAIFEKGDLIRQKEGLKTKDILHYGKIEDDFLIIEDNKKFLTNLIKSQKSGFFLDQRYNRKRVANFANSDFKVLDLFANAGGFGIYANAKYTKFVEISELACKQIETNCKLNNLKNYEIIKQDVFKFLENETKKYDLIIIDPPAFAKSKAKLSGALKGWKYLIANATKILNYGGYLALFSCSHAINNLKLLELATSVAIEQNINFEVIEFLKQDLDHPYLLTIPNSLYLSGVIIKKS
jgi:23S rRNA (cytosine1962-C5)-methyltransferase